MMPEWKTLYVRHNHEKAASRFLSAHGVDHYLPLYAERTGRPNRRKPVLGRLVFPGYLFVRFTPEQRLKVLTAPGVVCLTSESSHGAMTEAEITQLRNVIARGERPRFPISPGSLESAAHCQSQDTIPAPSALPAAIETTRLTQRPGKMRG